MREEYSIRASLPVTIGAVIGFLLVMFYYTGTESIGSLVIGAIAVVIVTNICLYLIDPWSRRNSNVDHASS